jgi:hypothetical protein
LSVKINTKPELWKKAAKNFEQFSKTLIKENDPQRDENSPNLVTLLILYTISGIKRQTIVHQGSSKFFKSVLTKFFDN